MLNSKSNKLTTFLLILLIISMIVNIYFVLTIITTKSHYEMLVKNDIEKHQGFYLLSVSKAKKNNDTIFNYIQNPVSLSLFIEGLKESVLYYRSAAQNLSSQESKPYKAISLIEQYISELSNYRSLMIEEKTDDFEYDINEIIHDIEAIGLWLDDKNQNHTLSVYTDEEFFSEVYNKLISDVKQFSFYEN